MRRLAFSTVIFVFGFVVVACGPSDHALLQAASLTVSPCQDHDAKTFAPFKMNADLLRWIEDDGVGQIEMRGGYRAQTLSDTIVLQVLDVAEAERQFAASPGTAMPLDNKLFRLSLLLLESCPDATQTMVGASGDVTFTAFDTSVGGHIEGSGRFDLIDARNTDDSTAVPVAAGATLEFDFKVRRGSVYEDYTR